MNSPCPRRPWICRALSVAIGLSLFGAGVRLGGLWGLVLMMVGLVPAVTGIADISLLSEIRDEREHRRLASRNNGSGLNPPRAA